MGRKLKTSRISFVCRECGERTPQWAGKCFGCGAWDSLVEVGQVSSRAGDELRAASEPTTIEALDLRPQTRTCTGQRELDRVLGGGLVEGSVVLVGGDPGIGKSTLLLQALESISRQVPALYITGEESLQQVGLRARRLGVTSSAIQLLAETDTDRIIAVAQRERPRVMVVDSIQTVTVPESQSSPGSVAQVRDSATRLVNFAKRSGTAMFLVGHVTKEGMLAGPRVLEHMVDTVLYFEGDSGSRFRLIRAIKNRYGAVNELGVFAMTDQGLREVSNPSALFISRENEQVPGSVIMVTREGTRPMLVEVQALVSESHIANPRRVAVGVDQSRIAMLLAVLHRHGAVATYDQDVFVNVVGGIRVAETGADLAVLLAVLSSLRGKPLPLKVVVFGEVGLAGEIRPVYNGQERLQEALKHGFERAIIPRGNAPKRTPAGLEITAVSRLEEALAAL